MDRPSAIPLPIFALKIIFGQKSDILFASQRQMPERLLKSGYKFLYPNLSQALQDVYLNKR
jgi:NAD dependent epimerase/dehydratase family enzyme